MDFLDLPAYFDPVNRIEGIVSTFRYADWRGGYERQGFEGLIQEFFACLTSRNAPTLYVARDSGWRGIDVEQLLRRHGVKIWDRGISGDDFYFCVKRRQVKWTEYLLLRAGVPVTSVLNEPRNVEWTEDYAPGDEPPIRAQRSNPLNDFLRDLLR